MGCSVSILDSCMLDPVIFPVKLLEPDTSIEPVTDTSFSIVVEPDISNEPVRTTLLMALMVLSNVIEEPDTIRDPDIV